MASTTHNNAPPAKPNRLSAAALRDQLFGRPPEIARTVRALRRTVLAAAPAAHEAIKFHVLSYFHDEAWFGSIGGNICMIEIKPAARKPHNEQVFLSFINGAQLVESGGDPAGLLTGTGKFKRFIHIPSAAAATAPQLSAIIRNAARLRPWE